MPSHPLFQKVIGFVEIYGGLIPALGQIFNILPAPNRVASVTPIIRVSSSDAAFLNISSTAGVKPGGKVLQDPSLSARQKSQWWTNTLIE